MINNQMIEMDHDLDTITYDTGIEIKINPKNFDYPDKFVKITSSQLQNIMMTDSSINKENLLMAFIYINSYIGCRPRNPDGSEIMSTPRDRPEAFYKSLKNMATDLSMSKDTINQCLEYLTATTTVKEALLIKKEVGSIKLDEKSPPQNVPNIYVLNKDNCIQEIEWALQKMLEMYKVNNFDEMKGKY